MNRYNLDYYLSNKSNKQVTSLVKTRLNKEEEAMSVLERYNDHWTLQDKLKEITLAKNAQLVIDDVNDWLNAAYILFSPSLWDSVIVETGFCLEGNSWLSRSGEE